MAQDFTQLFGSGVLGAVIGIVLSLFAIAFIVFWVFLPFIVWEVRQQLYKSTAEQKVTNELLRKLLAQASPEAGSADALPSMHARRE